MVLLYDVTGYDRQSGYLAVSYAVPKRKTALVKKIVGVPSSDDGLGSYPLGPDKIPEIAELLEAEIEPGKYDFYLEPFEEPPEHPGSRRKERQIGGTRGSGIGSSGQIGRRTRVKSSGV